MTAPDRAGTPGSSGTTETAGQAAYEGFVAFQGGDVLFETWQEKDEHGDSAVMGRVDWEAAGQAVVAWQQAAIAAAAPAPAGEPHRFTADTECADCALRAAILAEVEAAADTAASGEDPECETHADAILDLIHAARQPQAAPGTDATALRNLLDEETRLRWETGLDRQHTSQLRARAGLEALR